MKRIHQLAIGLAVCGALAYGAIGLHAQGFINRITGPGVLDGGGAVKTNNDGELASYSATIVGLASAASATDVACITGSATKTVRVQGVRVSGTSGTLVTTPILIRKNASADTGGSTGAQSFTPYAHLSTQAAASASVTDYSVNPTVNDTVPGLIWAQTLTLPTSAAGTTGQMINATWAGSGGLRAPVLSGVAQQLCVNMNGVTVATPSLNISFEWTEE